MVGEQPFAAVVLELRDMLMLPKSMIRIRIAFKHISFIVIQSFGNPNIDVFYLANGDATKAPPRKTMTAFLVQTYLIFKQC